MHVGSHARANLTTREFANVRAVGDEAARSRRLTAQARHGLGASSAVEARDSLQSRLNAYAKLMFWSFITLVTLLSAIYAGFRIQVRHWDLVFLGSTVMLAMMAFVWRILLVRRTPSIENMYRIDILFAVAIGLTFGASAALQYDLRPASFTSLLFTSFTVFTRALLVPSSARRTSVVSLISFVPVMAAGVFLALYVEQELPPIAFVGGGITFCAVAIVIATTGSGIIYGLRQQVDEAARLGQYRIDARIGAGGMGEVYRASHLLLRRPTAIKLLRPELGTDNLDRFEREVQAMSQLTHPNTVAVYDYGRSPDGVFYYAMEYLDGLDLAQLVSREGPQPADRIVDILIQVCGALQEAHDAQLIHRDIKPANIIVSERGGVPDVAKVVDFGLVKELTAEPSATAQVLLGTPGYMAPEQIMDGALGPAVDLYALGAVGYFLLTGQPVFQTRDPHKHAELLVLHVTATPRRPSEVAAIAIPPGLEEVILRCLAKAPADRYGSASDLAEALAALPRVGDWSRANARAWWRTFRATPRTPVPVVGATLTLPIDLGGRDPRRGA